MHGLSSTTKERIYSVIDDLFDNVAAGMVGPVPKLQKKKPFIFGMNHTGSLAHLFVQALGNKHLNYKEQDMLLGILIGAFIYIDILKNKTANNITQKIEALSREYQIDNDMIPENKIDLIIQEELEKAKSGLEVIVASEGTKTRNLGTIMDISKAAAIDGEDDPIIGFAGINNNRTCGECKRLFLMPDGVTPRLWKLSECSMGYFKKGENVPSVLGLHPHCTHLPFNVPKDWGFNKSGSITFIGIGHNELKRQRS
jgi:hypothetical protein